MISQLTLRGKSKNWAFVSQFDLGLEFNIVKGGNLLNTSDSGIRYQNHSP
jgi:hypothetical protein